MEYLRPLLSLRELLAQACFDPVSASQQHEEAELRRILPADVFSTPFEEGHHQQKIAKELASSRALLLLYWQGNKQETEEETHLCRLLGISVQKKHKRYGFNCSSEVYFLWPPRGIRFAFHVIAASRYIFLKNPFSKISADSCPFSNFRVDFSKSR